MKRVFDILFSLISLLFGMPLLLLIAVIGWFYTRDCLFRQERVGLNQKPFTLVKFRTMKLGTASLASHLVDDSALTPFGRYLRRTKLDELPQLWNVLKGDMSLVGPRPCLFNQHSLISKRQSRGVFGVRPGITGLAQIRGIDMSKPELLAETDANMISTLNTQDYLLYIFLTLIGRGRGDRVKAK